MNILLLVLMLAILVACGADKTPAAVPGTGRNLQFNGKPLTAEGLAVIARLEALYGTILPDGAYWYDPVCGTFGSWGGPGRFILAPNLALGGPVPANASGGGTGVFVNGRELHPWDVLYLKHLLNTPTIIPGRYFVDAHFNSGQEGGPILCNLAYLAQQNGGFTSRSDDPYKGTSHSISSEGVSFTNRNGKTESWYPGVGSVDRRETSE